MSTYIYKPDPDIFDSLTFAKGSSYERLWHLDIGSAATWKPLSVLTHRHKQRSDFPALAGHVPVFSKRALDTLNPLIADEIEILPLKSPDSELFAINVKIADCLDPERSTLERDPSGNVMNIPHYAFDAQCLRGKHIFRLRQAPLYKTFVSDEFKQRVEDSGLKGLTFSKVG